MWYGYVSGYACNPLHHGVWECFCVSPRLKHVCKRQYSIGWFDGWMD